MLRGNSKSVILREVQGVADIVIIDFDFAVSMMELKLTTFQANEISIETTGATWFDTVCNSTNLKVAGSLC